jgi:hypothetical protein
VSEELASNADGSRDLTRRSALGATMGIALSTLLVGCGSASSRRKSEAIASTMWPDDPVNRASVLDPMEDRPVPLPDRPTPETRSPAPPMAKRSVIARTNWTRVQPIPSRMNRQSRIRRITIHHDGMPPTTLRSRPDVASRLEQIRRLHVDDRGWGDIGYHYVVDPQGMVWEARPLSWQGAHVANQNPGNIGVLCLGNFEVQSPTAAQLDSLDAFVASLAKRHRVPLSAVATHQELAPTLCPGRNLQRHMAATRSSRGRLTQLAMA